MLGGMRKTQLLKEISMIEREKEQNVAQPGTGNTMASGSSESNTNPVPTPVLPKGGGFYVWNQLKTALCNYHQGSLAALLLPVFLLKQKRRAELQAQIQAGPSQQPAANVAQAINNLEGLATSLSPMFTKLMENLGKQ
jgi:hypothetical protein